MGGWGHPPEHINHTPGCREISGEFLRIFWEISEKFPEISWKFPGILDVDTPLPGIFKMILHNGKIKFFQSGSRKMILRSCLIHLWNI